MNSYNIIGYLVFISISFYITVIVGRGLYRSGEIFLVDSFLGDRKLAVVFNKLLLAGYYLLNLGYATVSVSNWRNLYSITEVVEETGFRLGILILGLAFMHYFNLFAFRFFGRYIESLFHHS